MTRKWMTMPLATVTSFAVLFMVAQTMAQETQALRTQREIVSYGIGVDMARKIQQQGIQVNVTGSPMPLENEVDLDLLLKGLKDALSGQKLLMSERNLRRTLIKFQGELWRKQAQTGTVMSEGNRLKGKVFLAENKTKEGVVTLPSGVQYKVLKTGEGRKPADADTVECNYRGSLIDGSEFDATESGKPATLKVAELIPGWKEAMKIMPVGSKWQIFIPADLAYGERAKGLEAVGPNETVILEVELLAIK
jgi:FKBP-type peptidyl-prolyl cis-trans isomerase